ncbi:hypothetical protein C4K27_3997 [Pseudomonas chlororaphis subsp. chlororaphis]|nr:hypothetical protein C4K27_3997 [Pseudomonas chlororaphis subsp. chlororaphis]
MEYRAFVCVPESAPASSGIDSRIEMIEIKEQALNIAFSRHHCVELMERDFPAIVPGQA